MDYDNINCNGYVNLKGAETLNTELSLKISFIKYIKTNAILDETNDNCKVFIEFLNFVDNMLYFRCLDDIRYQGFTNGTESIDGGIARSGKTEKFEEFLKLNQIDYKLEVGEVDGEEVIFVLFGDKRVSFNSIASTGTKALAVFYYWLLRLDEVKFVVIDEYDAFYHNSVARFIVETLSKVDAQSILTTHNTSLMSNAVMRPDCLYRLHDGTINSFSSNTQKELRKAHNIEKMYKAGMFDGE